MSDTDAHLLPSIDWHNAVHVIYVALSPLWRWEVLLQVLKVPVEKPRRRKTVYSEGWCHLLCDPTKSEPPDPPMVTYKDPNHSLEQGRVTNWLVIHSHVPIAPWRTEFSSTQKGVRIKIQVAEVETSKRKLLEIKTTQRQVDKVNHFFLTEIWWFSRNFAVFLFRNFAVFKVTPLQLRQARSQWRDSQSVLSQPTWQLQTTSATPPVWHSWHGSSGAALHFVCQSSL